MSNFRIYKTNSRIEIKIDEISIFISPLSTHQKMELQTSMMKATGDLNEAMKAVSMAMKMAIKDIKGVSFYEDGQEHNYELSFENGQLSDECVGELLNMSISNKISSVCAALMNGVPTEIRDHEGKPLEGVSIVIPKVENKKPKK